MNIQSEDVMLKRKTLRTNNEDIKDGVHLLLISADEKQIVPKFLMTHESNANTPNIAIDFDDAFCVHEDDNDGTAVNSNDPL